MLFCNHGWVVVEKEILEPVLPTNSIIKNEGGWGCQGARIHVHIPLSKMVLVLSCSKCGKLKVVTHPAN